MSTRLYRVNRDITMSELQAAEAEPEVQAEPEVEPVEHGSDLATDSTEEGEQNTDSTATVDGLTVEGPEGFKKAINKQHFKFREQERRADDLAQENKELRANIQPAPVQDVVVPALPEAYEDDYAKKMQERDTAIAHNATNAATKAQQAKANEQKVQTEQIAEVRRREELNDGFVKNADRLGVNREALTAAQNTVVQYGLSSELAQAIITDPEGPLIIQHLAANPLDLYELTGGDAFKAGQAWVGIKSKSSALKPKTSNAPAPATTLNGTGAPANKLGPAGATFE